MKRLRISFSTTALIIIVGLLVFFEVKSWVAGEKMDIFNRMIFSNKGQQKKIEIKSYILTNEQVKEFFKDLNKEPQQLTCKQLLPYDPILVLCIKNWGGGVTWGTLSYCFDGYNWSYIDIPDLGRKDETLIYVIPLGTCGLGTMRDIHPKVQTKWKSLYTTQCSSF